MKFRNIIYVVLFLLLVPTCVFMLRGGVFSMQDFPYFRVVEYSKCLADGQIPCRWASDAGLGFGEPVFNFYSHIPFLVGAILALVTQSSLLGLKLTFMISLVGSGFAMFFLARNVWGNNWAAFVSALLYVYAPYRAVNVWVRGALPEAFAFLITPLIFLFFEKFLKERSRKWLVVFSVSLASLVLTHNLSALLFAHPIAAWIIVRLWQKKAFSLVPHLFVSAVIAVLLSSFYLVPAVVESHWVNLQTTTQGYFDFRAHFVTLPQIFFSRFWGYGGSTWGAEDGLSLSVGQVQWIIALFALILAAIKVRKSKLREQSFLAIHLVLIGVFYLLLMHNKSAPLWEALDSVMQYIQFPWRFLGVALFSFSLVGGFFVMQLTRYKIFVATALVFIVIGLNLPFFREDIWRNVTDTSLQTGSEWVEQSRASIGDYWPKYGPIPTEYASLSSGVTESSRSSTQRTFNIRTEESQLQEFPIAFFPGWKEVTNGTVMDAQYSDKGLLVSEVQEGENTVQFVFQNTSVRTVANTLSALGIISLFILWRYPLNKKANEAK